MKTKICVICEKEYAGWGNNAEPVKEGQCCDECNWKKVIPARLKRVNVKKVMYNFEVGDVVDTQGNSNMVGKSTIRKIEGRSLYFTDDEGTDYQGFAKSTARELIKNSVWKKI